MIFGYKSAKDRLIETLQEEVIYLRNRVESLEAQLQDSRIEVEAKKVEVDKLKSLPRSRPSNMAERCQQLTRQSLERVKAKDPKRNLVADQPPPGAVPTGTAL